jgi:RHS repeat-associated protein
MRAPDGSTVLSDFTYQYNAVGDITNWVQTQGSGNPPQNAAYSYDGSDRLTGVDLAAPVTGVPSVTSYVYDNADNRLSEQRDALVMQGTFNSLNQLIGLGGGGILPIQGTVSKPANVAVNGKASTLNTNSSPAIFSYNLPVTPGTNSISITALDGSGNASTNNYQVVVAAGDASSYNYDADGNCLSDGTRSYQWDALNRLTQITQGSNTYAFAYDGQSRRISETDNGTLAKQWVWVGSQMAEEQDGSNNVTKRFYSQGEQQSGTAYYYTRDHLESVREMTDSSGNIVSRLSYDPYGRAMVISGTNLPSFQYTGDYTHQPSGLNLTKYRAYDPNTERWLSRDPLKDAEMSEGPNLYVYVTDEPISLVDPSGLGAMWSTITKHPDTGYGFNIFNPFTDARNGLHQLLKYGSPKSMFPAAKAATASTLIWTNPCGTGNKILAIHIVTKPDTHSGGERIDGNNAAIEISSTFALTDYMSTAIKKTTAYFDCECVSK